jgi:AcrR family transcriptional regulator
VAEGRITQKRGRIRRQKLLEAAEHLLENHPLDALTLGAVAKEAGVPKASAYHFYSDIFSLYAELSKAIGEELEALLRAMPIRQSAGWECVFSDVLEQGALFLDGKASRRELIWGSKVPLDIKRSDRQNDRKISKAILDRLIEIYNMPDFPRREEIFYQAIEIADLIFCLSMLDHGRLTKQAITDAQRAAIAYLRTYLPSELPLSSKMPLRTHTETA